MYEVGDVVRIIGKTRITHGLAVGSVGIIKKISLDTHCAIVLGHNGSGFTLRQYVHFDDLELEPKDNISNERYLYLLRERDYNAMGF